MSTVRPTEADDPGEPIESIDALIGFFASAEKPAREHRVGTEHEKFGFLADSRAPLPFDGPHGIEALFAAIQAAQPGRWEPALDQGRTVALFAVDGSSSLTLEPGGQFELSGAPLFTIHQTRDELRAHIDLLKSVAGPRGVRFFGVGFHPTATWDELPLVPKSRYAVMTRYMPNVGRRGLDMMKRTATVQANYDWASEEDMVQKYRAALATAPLVAALFASSPFVEGKPSGALSERQRVWSDTDPARAGFPGCVFDNNFGYESYVQWILDVPMYFIRRDGQYHDVAGASFRTFLEDGMHGTRATLRDFADHLTTIFPEVRMKRVLEIRSADVGPFDRVLALPALMKGVLYDAQATQDAWALLDNPQPAALATLRMEIAARGFRASWRGKSVLSLCERFLEIARGGLERIGAVDVGGNDETKYLRPIENSVAHGETYAEELLRKWRGPWAKDVSRVLDETAFY